MIFERDFDTPLPNEEDPEEFEEFSLDTPSDGSMPGRNLDVSSRVSMHRQD